MRENNPFKGKTHSVEAKQKMASSAKLRTELTEDDRKARWGHLKGKPWPAARRAAQLEKKLNKGKQ
jgi:hypothetical protein